VRKTGLFRATRKKGERMCRSVTPPIELGVDDEGVAGVQVAARVRMYRTHPGTEAERSLDAGVGDRSGRPESPPG
jgi:hypothetical protein